VELSDLQLHDGPEGVTLTVRVTPRAGRDALRGVRQGALLVRLGAAPVDGAANDALVRLLAESLDVPRRAVRLVSGERARQKRVRIMGLTAAAAAARLSAILSR
jgi:uncharacterized protein (TIGR00251 family)